MMHSRFKPWVRPWMVWLTYPFVFARYLKQAARWAADDIRDWLKTGEIR